MKMLATLLLTSAIAFSAPTAVLAQVDSAPVFHDEQRVTAVDLPVLLDRTGVDAWAKGPKAPQRLTPSDFTLRLDGAEHPISAVAHADDDEPWTLVLWFDAELSTPDALQWAATLAHEKAEDLVALGSVEIILADPLPHRLLAPTDDVEAVQRVLSHLALEPVGSDVLLRLRDDFLAEVGSDAAFGEGSAEVDPGLIDGLIAEESRIVTDQLNLLVTHLTATEIGGRKALVFATGGFDLDPSGFYGGSRASGQLAAHHDTIVQLLAAYGWITIPMVPAEPELLVHGLRIGKLLIRPLLTYYPEDVPDTARGDQYGLRDRARKFARLFLGLHATLEEQRDPDKAEAYLELGRALFDQGKLDDAASAYDRALYHFASDPRTSERQAEAYVGLGAVRLAQEDNPRARVAYESALRLAPGMAEQLGARATFLEPVRGLEILAETTAGRLVRDRAALDDTLDDLRQMLRFSFQLSEPRGVLQSIEIDWKRDRARPLYPRWTRSGTPEELAEVRLRRLLGSITGDVADWGPDFVGGLTVSLEPLSHPEVLDIGRVQVSAWISERAVVSGSGAGSLVGTSPRVSWAVDDGSVLSGGEGSIEIRHRTEPWTSTGPATLEMDTKARRIAVVVEDPSRGLWGARVLDLR